MAPATGWSSSTPGGDPYCRACRHNALVPDIADPANLTRWQVIERAKKRLFYSLLRFRLPLATRNEDAVHGLSFRFLNEDIAPVAGDDRPRERHHHARAQGGRRRGARVPPHAAQRALPHPARPLPPRGRPPFLGHPHRQPARSLDEFRALFGDETRRLRAALQRYYDQGAPRRLAGDAHLGLCHLASLGGLGRDLGALPPHRRHHRDGRGLRRAAQSQDRRRRRPHHPHRFRSLSARAASTNSSSTGCR